MDNVLAFPMPAWLAAYSDPTITAIVASLSDEAQQLYLRFLAEEARAPWRPGHPACRAFDRMDLTVMYLNHRRTRR